MPNPQLNLSNTIHILKHIGSGVTSDVYLCSSNEHLYAIKIYKHFHNSEIVFKKEQLIHSKLNFPGITSLLISGNNTISSSLSSSISFHKTIKYHLFEYNDKEDLFNYIFYPKTPFTEPIARSLFKDILQCVKECHSRNVVHLDLKLENIMFNKHYEVKLCDFGFAQEINNDNKLIETFVGTESYSAPEIIMRQPFNGYKADVFSLGVILFIMLTGKRPFRNARKFDGYYQYIRKGNLELFWKNIKKSNDGLMLSEEAVDLISKMICYDSNERISIDEILEHSFMKKEIELKENVFNELNERYKIIQRNRKDCDIEGDGRFVGIDINLQNGKVN